MKKNGETKVVTSNALRYEDARKTFGLDESWNLVDSTTSAVYDGKKDKEVYVDFIYAVEGTLPSGKAAIMKLYEMGAITLVQANIILDSKDAIIEN